MQMKRVSVMDILARVAEVAVDEREAGGGKEGKVMLKVEGGRWKVGSGVTKGRAATHHDAPTNLKVRGRLTAQETGDWPARLMLLVGPLFAEWGYGEKIQ